MNKSAFPNPLTIFSNTNPYATWEDFRNHNDSQDYKELKKQMLKEQGGLCAYCEKKVDDLGNHEQRIEHFHNKSDDSNPHKNWALDWNNLLLVCLGGSTHEAKIKYHPSHLSCDAHKETQGLPAACEGYYLNPVHIQTTVRLFDFDKATGRLQVNRLACEHLAGLPNHYNDDWCLLVEKTIEILNLNSHRLCTDRLQVMHQYNKQIKKFRERNDKDGFQKIAEREFSKKFTNFFTTWRSLLGEHAERYLESIDYDG